MIVLIDCIFFSVSNNPDYGKEIKIERELETGMMTPCNRAKKNTTPTISKELAQKLP